DDINCRVYIGAYNPCYSGAIMPHMQGLCNDNRRVITATSCNATQGNSYGWAGMWRLALRGGRPTDTVPWFSDTNQDGYIALDEAYEWETPHSNAHYEYPLFDDNCDGAGGSLPNPATYDPAGQDSTMDGFYGQFYSLMAWYDRDAKTNGHNPFLPKCAPLASGGDKQQVGSPTRDIEIQWSIGALMPTPVCQGASALIGDKIYLFGGHPSPAPIHYIYDIGTDTWSSDALPVPTPGSLTRGVVHDEVVYVFGGHTLGSDDVRRYDPATNAWELLSSPYPSGARECCKYGAAAVGDRIYYYYTEELYSYKPLLGFWEYDIATNSWAEKPAPPGPKRMYMASASDGSHCYAVGGIAHDDHLSVLADAIRYDPSTGDWEAIDDLPEPIAFADGDFLRGYLFIAGGGAGYGPWPASDRVYCWEENSGWLTATPLPAAVGNPHVELATIGGTDCIFVFGGYNGGYLNTLYIGEIMNLGQGVEEDAVFNPAACVLFQNSPNPFSAATKLEYTLPADCWVRLDVCDVSGRSVANLVDGQQKAGQHALRWDASTVCSGIYYYRLQAGDLTRTRKLIVLR
ncbi:MAG: T9SS type A sorting domain-containing protein, partial [Candidatus Eisenbacteria sp.]|nr:T9SS type A sorting domain-containing protein [Candidatus Eisenbacteria bacterium]